jgi:hypothetical protein
MRRHIATRNRFSAMRRMSRYCVLDKAGVPHFSRPLRDAGPLLRRMASLLSLPPPASGTLRTRRAKSLLPALRYTDSFPRTLDPLSFALRRDHRKDPPMAASAVMGGSFL